MVNINAQEWLDQKYPKNGICQRKNDKANEGKKRSEITHLDISQDKVGNKHFNGKVLVGELKLSGFTNLKTLSISSHQLTNLDISECPDLEELDCHSNQLTSLNTINNFHYLRTINCANNNLRELNLSGCSELQELNCVNNPYLKDIDTSYCPELTEEAINSDLVLNNEKNKLVKSISQITKASDDEVRNILIVGMTGGGKSTLANVLTDDDQFEVGDHSTSITSSFQKSKVFTWNNKKYRVIDNIGFSDTNSLTIIDILYEVGKGITAAKNKINQVLFVVSGKFTPEQVMAFNMFKEFIAESRITELTTLVRTNFHNFGNQKARDIDREALLNENEVLKQIIESCNDIVYLDNPPIPKIESDDEEDEVADKQKMTPIIKKTREKSREIILNHLVQNCSKIYKLGELKSIHEQIIAYMKKKEEKQRELNNANNDLLKSRLCGELKEEERKFVEQINVKLGIKIAVLPELCAEIELQDVRCCSIL